MVVITIDRKMEKGCRRLFSGRKGVLLQSPNQSFPPSSGLALHLHSFVFEAALNEGPRGTTCSRMPVSTGQKRCIETCRYNPKAGAKGERGAASETSFLHTSYSIRSSFLIFFFSEAAYAPRGSQRK